MENLVAGVEIGGTKIQVAVGTKGGEIQQLDAYRVVRADGHLGILAQIQQSLDGAAELGAIGIGFGGPVDRARGMCVCSHQISGWDDFPIGDYFSDRYGVDVTVENDANTAALAEARMGAGRGCSPVFYMTMGSGIGGGLVVDGQIYHGLVPGESEVGHLRIARGGKFQTLESLASGWAVDRRIEGACRAAPKSRLAVAKATLQHNAPLASLLAMPELQDDPMAKAILDEVAGAVAEALSHVANLFHPERIVIGGGLSKLGRVLISRIDAAMRPLVISAFADIISICTAELDEQVVPIGALLLTSNQ